MYQNLNEKSEQKSSKKAISFFIDFSRKIHQKTSKNGDGFQNRRKSLPDAPLAPHFEHPDRF